MPEAIPTPEAVLAIVKQVVPAAGDLTPTSPLLSSGIIDSLATAEFAEAVNDHFGTDVDVALFGYDNADNAEQIADLLRQT